MAETPGFLSKQRREVILGETDDDGTRMGQICSKIRMVFVDGLLLSELDGKHRARVFSSDDTYTVTSGEADEIVEQLLLAAGEYDDDKNRFADREQVLDRLPDLSGFGPGEQLKDIILSDEIGESEKRERIKHILSETLKRDPDHDSASRVFVGFLELFKFAYRGLRERGMAAERLASMLEYEINQVERELPDGTEVTVNIVDD